MTRFLISYNKADEAWAEWIAWVLNSADHEAVIRSWHVDSGVRFADAMAPALANVDRILVVLSERYISAEYAQPDWEAALADGAMLLSSHVIPVLVDSCQAVGVLGQIPAVDLLGLDQEAAQERVLKEVLARATSAPTFPQVESTSGQQLGALPTTAAAFPSPAVSKQNQANQDVVGDRNIIIGAADTGSNIVINNTYNHAAPESNDLGLAPIEDVGLVERILSNRRHRKIAIAVSGTVAVGLVAAWLSLPIVSAHYGRQGQQAQDEGDLTGAEQKYKRAITLNARNADAHYNLATLYEDRAELEQAEAHYSEALGGGFPEAYNNLGRLYLLPPEPKLDKAVALLEQGVALANKQQSFPEIQYTLYKNLGWARFQQGQTAVAEPLLKTAISISEQADAEFVINSGSAHCLLAQVLEGRSAPEVVLASWQRCCQEGDNSIPEESAWLQLARERLQTKGLDFNQSCKRNAVPVS